MPRDYTEPKPLIGADGYPTNSQSIRDMDAHNGSNIPLGIQGYTSAHFTVDNGLNQTVAVTIQGRNKPEGTWQAVVAATNVLASAQTSFTVGEPWAELRVVLQCAVAPTTGNVETYFVRVVGGSVATTGASGPSSDVDVTDRPARDLGKVDIAGIDAVGIVQGQKAMAASLPVVVASDQSAIPVTDNGGTLTVDGTVTANLGTIATAATEATLTALNGKVTACNTGAVAGTVAVTQATHDNLNLNANVQVANADVGAANRMPTRDLPPDKFEVVLTLDTNIYANGDVLAATQEIASVFVNGNVNLYAVRVVDEDDQGQALDLYLLRSNTSIGNENVAFTSTDEIGREVLKRIPILATDWYDEGAYREVYKGLNDDIGCVLEPAAGTSLYIAAVCRSGTPTYTASGIRVWIDVI